MYLVHSQVEIVAREVEFEFVKWEQRPCENGYLGCELCGNHGPLGLKTHLEDYKHFSHVFLHARRSQGVGV